MAPDREGVPFDRLLPEDSAHEGVANRAGEPSCHDLAKRRNYAGGEGHGLGSRERGVEDSLLGPDFRAVEEVPGAPATSTEKLVMDATELRLRRERGGLSQQAQALSW